ncbi:GumC family protein [Consotaella aegiceratis]|uniref:GumC family protein n=1 Tax=Consotaella aegiceratis TaxID=3097961 RepID=UPI002F40AA47
MFASALHRPNADAAPRLKVTSASSVRRIGVREDRTSGSIFDPVELFQAVWKLRSLVLFVTLAAIGLAVAIALATPKTYQAALQIMVDPRDLKVVQNEVTPSGLASDATLALIESQTSIITSNTVLFGVIDEADLTADPEFNGGTAVGLGALMAHVGALFGADDRQVQDRRLLTAANLREKIGVAREPKSFILTLMVKSTDPDKSARLANLIASKYMDEQARIQSDTARRATDALSGRLEELRTRVTEAENAVETYKADNNLIAANGRLIDDDYLVRINDELAKARSDIATLRSKVDSMEGTNVDDVVQGALPEELTSEALVRLRSTYSDLAHQAASLRTKLGPRHPQRIAAEQALASAREGIETELDRIAAAARTELARAQQTEKDLTAQLDGLKAKQVRNGEAFVRLRQLEREAEASRAVYEAFLLRAREVGEQEQLNTANVRVISDATRPLESSGLSRRMIVVIGAVAGFVVGLGLAFLWAMARMLRSTLNEDQTVRSESREMVVTQPEPAGAEIPTTAHDDPAASDLATEIRSTTPIEPSAKPRDPVLSDPILAQRLDAAANAPQWADESADAQDDGDPGPAEDGASTVSEEIDEIEVMDADAPAAETVVVEAPADDEAEAAGNVSDPVARGIAEDAATLRQRIRAIAAPAMATDPATDAVLAEEFDNELLQLHEDIAAVKTALAEMRRRRTAAGSSTSA